MPSQTMGASVQHAVDFAIGDSIAVGLNGAIGNHLVVNLTTAQIDEIVIAKQGIGPQNVLTNIKNLIAASPDSVDGSIIALSGGVSNNTAQIDIVKAQIIALTEAGAQVALVGVSTTFPMNNEVVGLKLNTALANIASATGAIFAGGFVSGVDHVHPTSYPSVLHQILVALQGQLSPTS